MPLGFEDTVKNLLKMKPKPYDEAKGGRETEDEPKPAPGHRSKDQQADPDQQKDDGEHGR